MRYKSRLWCCALCGTELRYGGLPGTHTAERRRKDRTVFTQVGPATPLRYIPTLFSVPVGLGDVQYRFGLR